VSRDAFIRARLQDIGLDSFPDNGDVEWELRSIRHTGDFSLVEAEPDPPTVGYPRFRFVLRFDASNQGVVVGCYALIENAWRILFTDPAASAEWKELFA
jgi:hypothetical protein